MQAATRRLIEEAGRSAAEISVLLTDDAEIQVLNREWRAKDSPTDVLSFPQSEYDAPAEVSSVAPDLLGDVVISVPTAVRQAEKRQWSLDEELALLLLHGTLHLLGYEDDTEAGSEEMKAIETRLLGKPLDLLLSPA